MDVMLLAKIVTTTAFVVILSSLFFPLGELKKKSREYRLHSVGSQLILVSYMTIYAWGGTPTNQIEGIVGLCGIFLAGLSSILTTLNKTKPFLTKLSLLILVVYLFMVII